MRHGQGYSNSLFLPPGMDCCEDAELVYLLLKHGNSTVTCSAVTVTWVGRHEELLSGQSRKGPEAFLMSWFFGFF